MKSLPTLLPSLRFESDADEQRFAEATYALWLRNSTLGGILALAFNNAFLLMDYMIGPRVFEVGLQVRFYLCTGFGLIVNVIGTAAILRWIHLPRLMQEALIMTGSILAGLSILLVAVLSPIQGTLWGVLYHAGLVPVLAFCAVMMRLRFRAMCVVTAGILLMHWAVLAVTPAVPGAPVMSVMLTVGVPSLFLLIFSYKFERDQRERFMQKQRAALLRDELQARRAALEQASIRDPLTGVVNRRGLSLHMDELASRQRDGKAPYAIVLIDIDHFKRYNDGYGHVAGDECLCAVSRALTEEAARLPGSVLARWGGEEFALAFPQDPAHDLLAIGERLCAAVAGAAVPHRYSSTASAVTISVGAASSAVAADETPWSTVFAQADAALYRAKHEGRNRACLASQPL